MVATTEEMVRVFSALVNEMSYSEFTTAAQKANLSTEEVGLILEILSEEGAQ